MNILSADKIEQARANNHAAFIAYLSAGYPDVDFSIDVARAVVEAAAVVMSYYNPVFRYGVDNLRATLPTRAGPA
ncbi:tryptophan synthase subunit alpha [Trueperella pecoris]|uniref:tryptophan synthase subunit alpha n=1 Tax=Trueperella pecoris TaxID=2733571 RepID=UPI001ABDB793|nr:tryptophan synthase subunit alpha [Trueperella pecoris]QTG74627.1 hypothetical protein J4179_05105 [Trueperella pecoris]